MATNIITPEDLQAFKVELLDAIERLLSQRQPGPMQRWPVRTLKSIEKGKKADIGECIGDFFLVLFLPIGIWFLQPRINKVSEGQKDNLITE